MVNKILIAEDETSISQALEDKLSAAGFTVKAVPNGHEVLEVLKTEKYDLLLLDLIMPRLDGFNTLMEMKNLGIDIKVVVLSNLGQTDDVEKVKKMGVLNYFIKSETPLSEIVSYLQQI